MCPDCGKAYVGQIGKNFSKRYNKHMHAFRNSSHYSKFAQHLNEHMHTLSPKDDMQILYYQKKRPTLKQYRTLLHP